MQALRGGRVVDETNFLSVGFADLKARELDYGRTRSEDAVRPHVVVEIYWW